MGIAIGDFDALVSNPVRDGHSGKAHINQQADVTVPQIVDSDALDSGGLGASVHLVMEIAFGHGENAVLLFQPVEHSKIVLHFLAEKLRHLDGTVAFPGFWAGNYILTVVRVVIQHFSKNTVISMVLGHPNSEITCIPPS